jgi:hypothetical protein
MELGDDLAPQRLALAGIPRFPKTGARHKFVAVMVHLGSAARANHLSGSLSHAIILNSGSVFGMCP